MPPWVVDEVTKIYVLLRCMYPICLNDEINTRFFLYIRTYKASNKKVKNIFQASQKCIVLIQKNLYLEHFLLFYKHKLYYLFA